MVEGVNADGKKFHVKQFLQPANPSIKFAKPAASYADYRNFEDGNMAVMIASGPYTLDNALDYAPLSKLLKCARELKPEVLILCGPFVDFEHSAFKNGLVDDAPEHIFKQEITLRLREFAEICPQTRIALIPSLRDVTATELFYPQCPLKVDSSLVPNTCLIFSLFLCRKLPAFLILVYFSSTRSGSISEIMMYSSEWLKNSMCDQVLTSWAA